MPLPIRPALALAFVIAATAAVADAPLVVLDRTRLPFDLGPGHPANSPSRTGNQPNAAANSSGNTANSSAAWENRPSNPANAKRLIFTAEGDVLGYYVPGASGVLNLFDTGGRRIAYRPAHGTQSLFTVRGAWCGTVDQPSGGIVLAVTQECASLFAQ